MFKCRNSFFDFPRPPSLDHLPLYYIPLPTYSRIPCLLTFLTPLLIHDTHPYGTYWSPLLKPFA